MPKIGFVTSWNEKCGVSEYSKTIVNGLIAIGCEVKVAANYPKDQVEPDADYVKRFFHTPFMTQQSGADIQGMVEYLSTCDLIHVQFETNLYSPDWFVQFIKQLKNYRKTVIFTMHSSGIWQPFPVKLVDWFLSHTKMWCTNELVNFPVEFSNPCASPSNVIKSFGLGRNNSDHVKEAIKGLNTSYETCYGTDKWRTKQEISDQISDSAGIALIYHPIGATVSSSAAAFALGTDRPLLITNTGWFQHIMHYPAILVSEYGDIEGLRENIEFVTNQNNKDYINNEVVLRKKRIIADGWDLESVCNKHLTIYKKLLQF
jgi:hypothetical protein